MERREDIRKCLIERSLLCLIFMANETIITFSISNYIAYTLKFYATPPNKRFGHHPFEHSKTESTTIDYCSPPSGCRLITFVVAYHPPYSCHDNKRIVLATGRGVDRRGRECVVHIFLGLRCTRWAIR